MAEPSGVSEIGYWSEIKLDILTQYASAYSTILSKQKNPTLRHVYIDAFSGAGFHVKKADGNLVWGSPTSVLLIDPPFREYHLIDLDRGNIEVLEEQVKSRTKGPYDPNDVYCYNGDCNKVLLTDVFPRVRYDKYVRGLCLLDPFGLHLDWSVVQTAGNMKSIEIFLNFPIMDINRNVLRRDPTQIDVIQSNRMTRFWGDESWRNSAYSSEGDLFGNEEKTTNQALAKSFKERLVSAAGFAYVPDPIAMRNSKGAVLYYLFFAAQRPVAEKIVRDIFNKHRDRRS
ncbi:MAG TPA: three-Cys-motif partner protein TcmP [Bacteroidota bacterium]|nr:three-Cys-motif partner protein TcmP [Bacteroidota bacterium]